MANYSRSRFYQLKEKHGYDYILLQDNYDKLWTYDNDAYALASFLNVAVQKNSKGEAFLKVDEDDLDNYLMEEIDDEDGAFFLPTEDASTEDTTLPSSALLKVILLSNYGERTIVLVSDDKEQDTNNGIYWEGRGFAKAILHAIDTKTDTFLFEGVAYLIKSVDYTEKFEKLQTLRHHFLNAEVEPQILYVYKMKSYTSENGLEPVTALFYYPGSSLPGEMTIFYSPLDHEYFVNQEVYNLFREQYGLPYVALNIAKGEIFPTKPEMAEESILHLYGYNVSSAEDLTDKERQDILARLMDYNIASKGKIENHLEFMIFLGEKNPMMINAVDKWKRDLLFTNSYKSTDQRQIWIQGVKHI